MRDHRKTVFPSGWYHFTITADQSDEDDINLVFTCDIGPRAGQNVVMRFNRTTGVLRLDAMCRGMCVEAVATPQDDFYGMQFIGRRCEAKVDSILKTKGSVSYITNVLIEWKPAIMEADRDVMKPKSDDIFFKQKNPKDLPIENT